MMEDGTFEHPYKTLRDAIAAAPVGSLIGMRKNSYSSPARITKPITLHTWHGTSTLQ